MENTIGKRIAALRREKGLKQEDVAQVLDVSSQAVSKWENNQSCPDISLLPKLAKLLGVSVDTLLSGSEAIKNIDWRQIIDLVQQGVIGNLLEIESEENTIRVFVE